MKILLSPAKAMKACEDAVVTPTEPGWLDQTAQLLQSLGQLSVTELQEIFKTSAKITQPVYEQYQRYKEGKPIPLYPAVFTYSGIAYQYMAPHIMEDEQLEYLQNHLRIISGLYGLLRPFDEIMIYRLEMGRKIPYSLYNFWSDKLATSLKDEDWLLNLASKEYAKAISPYLPVVTVRFYDQLPAGRKEKGVHAKMARGAMVRWCAVHNVTTRSQLESFDEFGFQYDPAASSETEMVFVRDGSKPIKAAQGI